MTKRAGGEGRGALLLAAERLPDDEEEPGEQAMTPKLCTDEPLQSRRSSNVKGVQQWLQISTIGRGCFRRRSDRRLTALLLAPKELSRSRDTLELCAAMFQTFLGPEKSNVTATLNKRAVTLEAQLRREERFSSLWAHLGVLHLARCAQMRCTPADS